MNSPLHPGTQGLLHILVIGCAGFVGWNVTEFLLADGHNVVGVDNLNDASDVRLKHWRLAQLEANQASPFIPWGLIPRGLPRPCTPTAAEGVLQAPDATVPTLLRVSGRCRRIPRGLPRGSSSARHLGPG